MIHPTAIIDSRAEIDSNVTIGPFAIVKSPYSENIIRLIPQVHLCFST